MGVLSTCSGDKLNKLSLYSSLFFSNRSIDFSSSLTCLLSPHVWWDSGSLIRKTDRMPSIKNITPSMRNMGGTLPNIFSSRKYNSHLVCSRSVPAKVQFRSTTAFTLSGLTKAVWIGTQKREPNPYPDTTMLPTSPLRC